MNQRAGEERAPAEDGHHRAHGLFRLLGRGVGLLACLLLPTLALAGEVELPRPLSGDGPSYPDRAREQQIEGTVQLLLDVDAEGAVTAAVVTAGTHPLLDEAAVRAARDLRFSPGTDDGVPTAMQVPYRFVFDLSALDSDPAAALATLHATVQTAEDHPLEDAVLTVLSEGQPLHDAVTNGRGLASVSFLAPGDYLVRVSAPGFADSTYDLSLEAGQTLRAHYTLAVDEDAVIIVHDQRPTWRDVDRGRREVDQGTVTGLYELTRRDMESTPGSMDDITRAVHALPGVAADGDMLAGFHVRGGEQDDVVYLLDGVPLDSPFHLAGFNSIFNPDMVRSVDFYAGAPPADVPAATSAVMSVHSWSGEPREDGAGLDGAVDLSGSGARLLLLGPVDPQGKLTIALAARRTWLEAYLAVMEAANLVDKAFAAPEYSELSARVAWRPSERTRLTLTVLRTGDSLTIADSEDDSLIEVSGTFDLRNRLFLSSLAWQQEIGEHLTFSETTAYVGDRSSQIRELAGSTQQDSVLHKLFQRADLSWKQGEHTLSAGGTASWLVADSAGSVQNNRLLPTWTQAGLTDFGLGQIEYGVDSRWAEVEGYGQWEYAGPVRLRAGLRATHSGLVPGVLWSPRAGVSVPLPTATVPKASVGQYYRVHRNPFDRDATTGNPDLQAERARHLVVGVDQGIPLGGDDRGMLLRIEGYHIALDNLAVHNLDSSGPLLQNAGSGHNSGVDLMAAFHTPRWTGQLSYGLLWAERTDPLNGDWPDTVAPPQDQRHTVRAMVDWQASPRWKLGAQAHAHSGRPVSQVSPATADTVQLSCLNCDRIGPTVSFDLRAEWRRSYKHYRLTFYSELLNVGNIQSPFLPIYNVEDDAVVESALYHLPMRPFLGIRADF